MIKRIYIVGICMIAIMCMTQHYAQSGIERSSTVTQEYDAWYHCPSWWNPRPLGTGYVSVAHKVDMVSGSENVQVCDLMNFVYKPDSPFFVDNQDGVWDTPYGIWKSHIDDHMSFGELQSGQIVSSRACGPHTPSKAGYINWSAVKPGVTLESSDTSVIQCMGMQCEAVGTGHASITARVAETSARVWGYLFFGEAFYGGGAYVSHNINHCKLLTVSGMRNAYKDQYNCSGVGGDADYDRDNGILTLPPISMAWNISVSPATSGICVPQNGVCGTRVKAYDWNESAWPPTLSFCDNGGVSTPLNPAFPAQGAEVTWTCSGQYGGTATTCKATRGTPPPCACGSVHGTVTTSQPTTNLCVPSTLIPDVTLSSDGTAWSWTCSGANQCTGSAECNAECVRISLDVPEFIYLKESDNVITGRIAVDGVSDISTVTCTVNDTPILFTDGNSESDQFTVSVTGGGTDIKATCNVDDPCQNGSGTKEYVVSKYVNSMCVSRSCNSQGTCQAVPQSASNVSDCKGTCNSDADCSTGRMIETRP